MFRVGQLFSIAALVCGLQCGTALAQEPPAVAAPNFIDQNQRVSLPQGPLGLPRIRFLTSVDFPPFSFLDSRGLLTGFNIDLARAICDELDVIDLCQVEARPFDELAEALEKGEGEAIIAGVAISGDSRRQFAFTRSYLHFPARFVALRDVQLDEAVASGFVNHSVAVVEDSAHQAMLRAFFPQARPVVFADRDAGLAALRRQEVEAFFGDGVGLSFWLSSDAAENCCAFAGGPFLSDRFLGEGLAFALAPENAALAARFDEALRRIVANGRFSEIMLRYFPVSAF